MPDSAVLLSGLLLSSIGLGYFIFGRKQENTIARYCGLALIIFPYFAGDIYMMLGIGAALIALPFVWRP